ncbi:MAG: methyltransferase domain-containing protein [Rhodospirillales bacterium]
MKANGVNGTRATFGTLDLDAVRRAYRRYAPTYDLLFGPIFHRGRVAVAERVNRLEGQRVLEVGVGTGLALLLYDRRKEITGIDVSQEMLSRATARVAKHQLKNVRQISQMDAETLDFPDNSFDVVVASYVMSVVPDPHRCLAEMERVCAPGGTIFICNHFVNGSGSFISPKLQPLSRWLGWRPNFILDDLLEESPLQLEAKGPIPPVGLFHLVTLRKTN